MEAEMKLNKKIFPIYKEIVELIEEEKAGKISFDGLKTLLTYRVDKLFRMGKINQLEEHIKQLKEDLK
jgi:superfamily II DNA/RNA helicase